MDRIEELAIFVAIVDAGSLAGAARRLRKSRPAVTRALAGRRPMVASMATDLPEPLSPTMASTSRLSTEMSMPSTANTTDA